MVWKLDFCLQNYQPEVLENLTWKLLNTITNNYVALDQILIVWLIWMMEHCLQFQYHSLVSPWFHCKSQCLLRCPSCKAWHADSSIQYCIANWLLLHAHPLKNYCEEPPEKQEAGGVRLPTGASPPASRPARSRATPRRWWGESRIFCRTSI